MPRTHANVRAKTVALVGSGAALYCDRRPLREYLGCGVPRLIGMHTDPVSLSRGSAS